MREKFFSMEAVKKYDRDITYYVLFGERGSGKSFHITRKAIDEYFERGREFVIVKRLAEDITTKFASTMLRDHEEYIKEKYGYIVHYYGHRWYVYPMGDNKPKVSEMPIMGYALAISQSNSTKGGQYPRVGNIILEEFMSMGASYLKDEVKLFVNLVSTIARKRVGIKVYLLGNPLNKISPYDRELGVKLYRLDKGETIVKEFSDDYGRKNRILVHRTNTAPPENDGSAISLFGSNASKMIDGGEFETGQYPIEASGWTFRENLKELPLVGSYRQITAKKHGTNYYIRYADFWYRIYIVKGKNVVLGFRNVKHPNDSVRIITINNDEYLKNAILVPNLVSFNNKSINSTLDLIVGAFKQNSCVFLSDDNGEDVYSGFQQAGIGVVKR